MPTPQEWHNPDPARAAGCFELCATRGYDLPLEPSQIGVYPHMQCQNQLKILHIIL